MIKLSNRHARRFVLGKQGLWPGRRFAGKDGTEKAIHATSLLQLDPLNVAGRAHDLILQSRVVEYRPEYLDTLSSEERKFFDWGSWLATRPMEELPYWNVLMKRASEGKTLKQWRRSHAKAIEHVLGELRDRGPLGNRDFKGTKAVVSYRGSKDTSLALYYLWTRGDIMTHHRERFERRFDLRERIAPAHLLHEVEEEEADLFVLKKQVDFEGFSSFGLNSLYHRIPSKDALRLEKKLVQTEEIIPVEIEGEKKTKFILAKDLSALNEIQKDGIPKEWKATQTQNRDEVIFLSPLDVVSARGRAKKLFHFDYIWEVYKPVEKRVWGYYVLPILWEDALVGRMDVRYDISSATFKILGFWLEDGSLRLDSAFRKALQAGVDRFRRYLQTDKLKISGQGAAALRKLL